MLEKALQNLQMLNMFVLRAKLPTIFQPKKPVIFASNKQMAKFSVLKSSIRNFRFST